MTIRARSLDEIAAIVTKHGGSDLEYLSYHFDRFAITQAQFMETWPADRGTRVLDIGAHWLHQAVMWAIEGFEVTAVDLPITFEIPGVRALAAEHGIKLIPNHSLEAPQVFADLPADSFDVMLFTEILEHLTFNPVAFWKEIYRVMAPGSRIIITTPNYYALSGRVWQPARFLRGLGGGITADGILNFKTYAHHWKEFSLREVIMYFCLLSPDWITFKAKHVKDYYPRAQNESVRRRLTRRLENAVPILRPNLHLEIELIKKENGIAIDPTW